MNLKEVQARLGKKFIYVEEVVATLYFAHEVAMTGQPGNVILFGPPGHGKSQLSAAFLDVMGYQPNEIYKTNFGYGTKPEHLMGIPSMEKFQKGVLEYNVENAFISRKAAIFEELFDASKSLLTWLKDILMAKEYCAGGEVCYKSSCNFIIAPTNVNPTDWIANSETHQQDAVKALTERFPFQMVVDWPSYNADDYARLIELVLGQKNDVFCKMMETAAQQNATITPRTAVVGCVAYNQSGVRALKHLHGVTPALYNEFVKLDSEQEQMLHINNWIGEAKQLIKKKHATAKELREAISELNRYPTMNTELIAHINEFNTQLEQKKSEIEAQFLNSTLYK